MVGSVGKEKHPTQEGSILSPSGWLKQNGIKVILVTNLKFQMKKLEADKEEVMKKNEEIASMFLLNCLNLCFTSLLNISYTLLS